MRYHDITTDDMKNGDGLRTVLWVAGCSHHCEGCQNPITWDPNGGIEFDDDTKKELYGYLQNDYINGITFSGGDPLHPQNIPYITVLAKEIKSIFPTKTIWLYTGYLWEQVRNLEIIRYLNVMVDGEFVSDLMDVSLHWKGSANQRVIDVIKTLEAGCVVLHTS